MTQTIGRDIHEEIRAAREAYEACPRWRVLKRRDLRDHLLMCEAVLRSFEDAVHAVQP